MYGLHRHLYGLHRHLYGLHRHLYGLHRHLYGLQRHLYSLHRHLYGLHRHLYSLHGRSVGARRSLPLQHSARAGLQPVSQRPFTAVPHTSAGTHGLQIRANGDYFRRSMTCGYEN
ncbi:MAG: hypothetical protein LBR10_06195 [Prevotellaceae bacterium]|nr:hypothetical protein [Prevotellaceae bacterium]